MMFIGNIGPGLEVLVDRIIYLQKAVSLLEVPNGPSDRCVRTVDFEYRPAPFERPFA